jgi:hypothetical protein
VSLLLKQLTAAGCKGQCCKKMQGMAMQTASCAMAASCCKLCRVAHVLSKVLSVPITGACVHFELSGVTCRAMDKHMYGN